MVVLEDGDIEIEGGCYDERGTFLYCGECWKEDCPYRQEPPMDLLLLRRLKGRQYFIMSEQDEYERQAMRAKRIINTMVKISEIIEGEDIEKEAKERMGMLINAKTIH